MGRVVDPKRWENKWHFPPWLGVVLVLGIVILLPLGSLWFLPSGAGETRESPDGKYEASAFNYEHGTIWGDRPTWDEIRVTEKKTGREVWVVKRHPPPGTSPEYHMRGVKFIEWAADSSAVTVDIGGGQKLTFPVP